MVQMLHLVSNPYKYMWNKPTESGQYCVKVKVTSNGARDSSGVFNVDLARPEVTVTVGDPQMGDKTVLKKQQELVM